jgi:uncharacterized caspase-like protein
MRGRPRRAAAALVRLAGLAGPAMLLTLGLSACVLDVPYDKYAIVYGVSIYDPGNPEDDGNGPNLIYPNDDADAMEAMLLAQGFLVRKQTDENATLAILLTNIDSDIKWAAANAKKDDLFVFYFSGHGGYAGTGPEPPAADSLTEWIYLHDSLVTPPPYSFDYSKTLSDDDLLAALAPIKARKKVIILDSCNSGGFIGNALEADGEPPSLASGSEGVLDRAARAIRLYANFDGSSADIPPWEAMVLSASGERESSYEFSLPFEHGIFTYYLLQAETEGDLNHDGWVTVTEAFAYTQEMIYRYWNDTLYGDIYGVFSPHVSGGPVDYVLLEAR